MTTPAAALAAALALAPAASPAAAQDPAPGGGCGPHPAVWPLASEEDVRCQEEACFGAGDAFSCSLLSMFRLGRGEPGLAVRPARAACEGGDAHGCLDLGLALDLLSPSPAPAREAAAAWARACDGTEDDVPEACFHVARRLLAEGRFREALAHFDRGCLDGRLEKGAHEPACRALVRLGLVRGMADRVEELLGRVCGAGHFPWACVDRANMAVAAGDVEAAVRHAGRACDLGLWETCRSLGDQLLGSGDPEGAARRLGDACRHGAPRAADGRDGGGPWARACADAAGLLRALGREEEARGLPGPARRR